MGLEFPCSILRITFPFRGEHSSPLLQQFQYYDDRRCSRSVTSEQMGAGGAAQKNAVIIVFILGGVTYSEMRQAPNFYAMSLY